MIKKLLATFVIVFSGCICANVPTINTVTLEIDNQNPEEPGVDSSLIRVGQQEINAEWTPIPSTPIVEGMTSSPVGKLKGDLSYFSGLVTYGIGTNSTSGSPNYANQNWQFTIYIENTEAGGGKCWSDRLEVGSGTPWNYKISVPEPVYYKGNLSCTVTVTYLPCVGKACETTSN